MAKLTAKARKSLPNSAFAGPGRSYPVHDKSHAAFAIKVASAQHAKGKLSASEYKTIHAKASRVLNMKDGGSVMKPVKSNMSKNFAKKAEMCLADGGLVSNRMNMMENIAGNTAVLPTTPAPAPTPPPAAPAAPAQPMSAEEIAFRTKYGMAGGTPQPSLLDKAKNLFKFADGGYVPPGTDLMPRQSPETLAANAGFPVAGAPPPVPLHPAAVAPPVGSLRNVNAAFVPQDPNRERVRTIASSMSGVRGADGGMTEDIENRGLRGAIRHGQMHYGAGKVSGPGGPKADKVPAMLSNGEYVIPADVVKKIGKDNLDDMIDLHHDFGTGTWSSEKPDTYADGGVIRTDVPGSDFFNDQMHEANISRRAGNYGDAVGQVLRGTAASVPVALGEAGHRVVSELAPVGRAMLNVAGGFADSDTLRNAAAPPLAPTAAPVAAKPPVAAASPGTYDTDMPMRSAPGMGIDRIDARGQAPTFTNTGDAGTGSVGTVPAGASDAVLGLRGPGSGAQRVSVQNGGIYSPEVSAALSAAAARGDPASLRAVQDFYQKGGGTFRGNTAAQDSEEEMVNGLRRTPKGRGQLAAYYAAKDQNAATRENARLSAAVAGSNARLEQMNKDRQYDMEVQKYGQEVANSNRAAREGADKALQSNLESRFQTTDAKGNSIPDRAKIADFHAALDTSLPQFIHLLQTSGKPGDAAKAQALEQRGKSALEPADIEGLHQLYNMRERGAQSRGLGPNQGTFKHSNNLFDYAQLPGAAGVEHRTFGGNRIVTPAMSVSANDLRYKDGPANAIVPDFFKVEDRDLTRGLRTK